MIHNKIHLIRPGCLQPSIALTVQNRGLKHHPFIVIIIIIIKVARWCVVVQGAGNHLFSGLRRTQGVHEIGVFATFSRGCGEA